MKRAFIAAITVCCLAMIATTLGGCGMSQDAAAEKVKAHLEEKYGEEFVIEASGGGFGTADNTTWKVIFHPAAEPGLRGYATVGKDDGEVQDYYTGARVAREVVEAVQSDVAGILAGRVLMESGVSFENPMMAESGTRDMSASDYFAENPGATLGLAILTDATLTQEQTTARVNEIARLIAPIAPNAAVYLAIVDASTYDKMASSPDSSEKQDIVSKSVTGRGAQAWIEGAEISVAPIEWE